jgi:hypothetical protein
MYHTQKPLKRGGSRKESFAAPGKVRVKVNIRFEDQFKKRIEAVAKRLGILPTYAIEAACKEWLDHNEVKGEIR